MSCSKPSRSSTRDAQFLAELKTAYGRVGLHINAGKTKVMLNDNVDHGGNLLPLAGEPLKAADHFNGVGNIISRDCTVDCDIVHRIQKAGVAFRRLLHSIPQPLPENPNQSCSLPSSVHFHSIIRQ